MYTPAAFGMDADEARAVIESAGAGTLVVHDDDGFDVAVVPFVHDGDRLLGHVARANPIWRREGPVIVCWTPVDGYVSPAWYPSKIEHGRVVPTWNYVTVVAHGRMTARHDAGFLRDVVTRLTDRHEARTGTGWHVTDAPADHIDGLLRAIVGIEIHVDRIEGKAKLSQNRPASDVDGVIAANPNPLGDAMRSARRARAGTDARQPAQDVVDVAPDRDGGTRGI